MYANFVQAGGYNNAFPLNNRRVKMLQSAKPTTREVVEALNGRIGKMNIRFVDTLAVMWDPLSRGYEDRVFFKIESIRKPI